MRSEDVLRNSSEIILKRSTFYLLLAVTLLAIPACAETPDCSREEIICAGLVTNTGGLDDHGFSQDAWNHLQRVRGEGLIQYGAYIETVDSRDYEKNIATLADDHYDIVITSGNGLRTATLQAADEYPDTIFIGIDQLSDETRPNLIVIRFSEDQMGFLAGALAALITKTDSIGAVCETSQVESVWKACDGFEKGAAYINDQIKVTVAFREGGSSEDFFADPEWGHEQALILIENGSDVIFGVGGGTGQGALSAAAEQGVFAIGSGQDQFYVMREARDALVTSMVESASPGVADLIRLIRMGQAPQSVFPGRVEVAPYHDFESRISMEVQDQIETIRLGLLDGTIQTGVSPRPK